MKTYVHPKTCRDVCSSFIPDSQKVETTTWSISQRINIVSHLHSRWYGMTRDTGNGGASKTVRWAKQGRYERVHIVWSQLHEILEGAKPSSSCWKRINVTWDWGSGVGMPTGSRRRAMCGGGRVLYYHSGSGCLSVNLLALCTSKHSFRWWK